MFAFVERREVLYTRIEELLAKWPQEPRFLIPVLQAVQEQLGYLPPEALEKIAEKLGISLSRVYGVATFYTQFVFKPRGQNFVRICLGTACHVRGAAQVLEELIRWKEVEVEPVRCLGACALAPVVVTADGKYHGGMTPLKVRTLIQTLRKGRDG